MNLKKVFISLVFVLAAMCMCAYAKTAELNIGSTDAAMMEDSVIKDKILTAAPYAKGGRTYVPVFRCRCKVGSVGKSGSN